MLDTLPDIRALDKMARPRRACTICGYDGPDHPRCPRCDIYVDLAGHHVCQGDGIAPCNWCQEEIERTRHPRIRLADMFRLRSQ